MDVKLVVDKIAAEVGEIEDPKLKSLFSQLLAVIEFQAKVIRDLQSENRRLRDENNRLKGNPGRPHFRKQTSTNISSEKERGHSQKNMAHPSKAAKKKEETTIHRTEVCKVDQAQLPADAVFKGYEYSVVKDILIIPNNVEFKKEVYYSPSLRKTFIADVPKGYEGRFGPHVKSLVLDLHYTANTTESSIHWFFKNHNIAISVSSIARMLTEKQNAFHDEKKEIVKAGLKSTSYQHMDDTGAREKGKNQYTHVLCNELYTAFFTRRS